MKELSIEEKAKRYDEVVESVKKEKEKSRNLGLLEFIDENFPELAESEDDRIRKELIRAFNSLNTLETWNGIKRTDILTWLKKQGEKENFIKKELDCIRGYRDEAIKRLNEIEKQGEQTSDKVEPKFRVGDIVKRKDNPHLTYILKRFTDDGDYEFHAIGKDGHEGCICFSVVKYQDEWELVEQKPADTEKGAKGNNREIPSSAWSEEDILILDDTLYFIKEYQRSNRCKDENGMQNSVTCEKWLKSLKDRVLPQPKQEWSEGDEKMLKDTIRFCELCGNKVSANWLKSIRPQNRWKPSEEHYELEEFAKIVRSNLTGISKAVQELFEAKYLQLTGNKMYQGFKD